MNRTDKIRILIADDHTLYREGLRTLLEGSAAFAVIGEAANGRMLVEMVETNPPDVVLTDIVMPIMDGLSAIQQIHQTHPEIALIALTMFGEESQIIDIMEAGALGYLLKNASPEEIVTAIHTVYRQQPYDCRTIAPKLSQIITRCRHHRIPSTHHFNDTEHQIIRLLCEDKTSAEIAKLLLLNSRNVEKYRMLIIEKMQVRNTAGIVLYAVRHGLYKLR